MPLVVAADRSLPRIHAVSHPPASNHSGGTTLATAIGRASSDNRAMPVTIRADARATHQSVVTAMDVAGRAGYRQINIATVNDGQAGR